MKHYLCEQLAGKYITENKHNVIQNTSEQISSNILIQKEMDKQYELTSKSLFDNFLTTEIFDSIKLITDNSKERFLITKKVTHNTWAGNQILGDLEKYLTNIKDNTQYFNTQHLMELIELTLKGSNSYRWRCYDNRVKGKNLTFADTKAGLEITANFLTEIANQHIKTLTNIQDLHRICTAFFEFGSNSKTKGKVEDTFVKHEDWQAVQYIIFEEWRERGYAVGDLLMNNNWKMFNVNSTYKGKKRVAVGRKDANDLQGFILNGADTTTTQGKRDIILGWVRQVLDTNGF